MKAIRKRSRKEPFRGVINGLVGTRRRFTSPEATHTQRHIVQTVAAVPWTDVSTAVRLPQICDLVYLVSIVSQWPIDMRQNVRDQESQVSLAWPRVVIRDLKQGRRRRQ